WDRTRYHLVPLPAPRFWGPRKIRSCVTPRTRRGSETAQDILLVLRFPVQGTGVWARPVGACPLLLSSNGKRSFSGDLLGTQLRARQGSRSRLNRRRLSAACLT